MIMRLVCNSVCIPLVQFDLRNHPAELRPKYIEPYNIKFIVFKFQRKDSNLIIQDN